MKVSRLFGKTVKKAPVDIQIASHKFLYQGGFIRELVAGRYEFLPLGFLVWEKVLRIIDEEMKKIEAQRVLTPTLHPIEIWKETKRDQAYGSALMRVKDRRGAEFAIGATAEGIFVDLVRKFKPSYKDLPIYLYQFSDKFRDEVRARGGLLRVREFTMKDAYSFDRTESDFLKTYKIFWQAYLDIAKRFDLPVVVVESDNGELGGDYAHEFMVPSDVGEDTVMQCACGYAANLERAEFVRDEKNLAEAMKPSEVREAKRGPTIADGVKLYGQPAWRQIKTVIYVTDRGEFLAVVLRGDLEINEVKLKRLVKANELRPATDQEIAGLGSVTGFISPLKIKVKKIGDISLRTVRNFSTGADVFQRDTVNVNYPRDFQVDIEADVANASDGRQCARCQKGKLRATTTVEWGNLFKYDTFYTKPMRGVFVDEDGREKELWMGAYGIGLGRTISIVIEKHHDQRGIIWPKEIAPYQVHLVSIGREASVAKAGQMVYDNLIKNGLEVLWDERDVSPGVKFADADLIGIPLRLVVSPKTLAKDGYEWKERNQPDSKIIKADELIPAVKKYYQR